MRTSCPPNPGSFRAHAEALVRGARKSVTLDEAEPKLIPRSNAICRTALTITYRRRCWAIAHCIAMLR